MTTQEKNELLARFTGHNKINGVWIDYSGKILAISSEYLRYHEENSGWLLPVWYKFRELQINQWGYRFHYKCITIAFSDGTFTDLYDALVDAVQWYNSIQK